jgi:hypothetical protein
MAGPRLKVVHNIPGRLRVRLPTHAHLPGLEVQLLAHSGVRAARHVPRTRSVVIQYHPEETTAETLLHALAAITGIEVDAGFAVGDLPLSESITGAVSRVNTALTRHTANQIDLPTLLALSLGGGGAPARARAGAPTAVADRPVVCVRAIPAPRSGR